MKNVILALALSLSGAANAAQTYSCHSKYNNGYFITSNQYGVLTVFGENSTARLHVLDIKTNKIVSTFYYDITGVNNGKGKVAGMFQAKLDYQKSVYIGDAISKIYFDKELVAGKNLVPVPSNGGTLVFYGSGWDFNNCIIQQK